MEDFKSLMPIENITNFVTLPYIRINSIISIDILNCILIDNFAIDI